MIGYFWSNIFTHWLGFIIPSQWCAPCGLWGCKNRPAPFPGRMLYKATKPGLVSVLYLNMLYAAMENDLHTLSIMNVFGKVRG